MKKISACTALLLSLSLSNAEAQEDDASPRPVTQEETPLPEAPAEESLQPEDRIEVIENPPQTGISDFRIGPSVQIGFPHPVTFGIEGVYTKLFSFGVSGGSYTFDLDPAEITIASYEAHGRWHPWAGSFFLGAAYGKQSLSGTAEDDVAYSSAGVTVTTPAVIDVDIDSAYFTPHLGWFAVWDSGLSMGFEMGLQIPLSPKSEVKLNAKGLTPAQEAELKASEDYKDLKKKADDAAQLLGEKSVPYVTLLRIGYVF